ncbi:MgtC/SapB family protein [Pedobacter sp. MC2016-14]|uniref:MgtC/SapB family protein n=1 Tax=Pedobacter sp. MC2016-14 TaxID=2897327 RepID=UPI001E5C1AC2|nr:MgtC/SapB family protein [Pedobacter sp. MC2016-14]MCD0487610.1 MgtC/SapB family protein [Pedobacter sp. MC2016-14]
MDFIIEQKDIVSMLMAILCGGIIGFEREYKSKSAGFRTIILITLGSTIFTIVSGHGTGADDRIAANIITGIGFIGAGVIFKDQVSVRGLTTAAVIWTSAAIGMTTGIGYHALAFVFTIITLIILLMVSKIEKLIGKLQKQKIVSVTFRNGDFNQIRQLEEKLQDYELLIERLQVSKSEDMLTVIWQVSGKKRYLNQLSETLATHPDIITFL